jgi:hypothetical protein
VNERELLEWAAKACGLDLAVWDERYSAMHYPHKTKLTDCHYWNPLIDDGDALRLAAALEIRAGVSSLKAIADWWKRPSMTELDNVVVLIDGDPCAALRRAITLAAAEIGKAMP